MESTPTYLPLIFYSLVVLILGGGVFFVIYQIRLFRQEEERRRQQNKYYRSRSFKERFSEFKEHGMKGWTIAILIFVLLCVLATPFDNSKVKNKDIRITLDYDSIIIPEKYGYLGGLFNYDTLEVYKNYFLIRKHSLFSDGEISIPTAKIKKVVIGTTLGQKYVEMDYEGGIFGSSYTIYVNEDPMIDYLVEFLGENRIIIER